MFPIMGKGKKMLTAKEYAEKCGVGVSTVHFWLKQGLLPGAVTEPLPYGSGKFLYLIPEKTARPAVKPGPKPRKKATKA